MNIILLYFKSVLFLIYILFPTIDCKGLDLILFHSNNIHSHFKESNENTGGAARATYIISKARRKALEGTGPPALYLNAGDNFGGSSLYHEYKWPIVADFLKVLKPDVICLGNHDFDEGLKNLTKFLKRINIPVVGANIKTTNSTKLFELIKPYHILNVSNWMIGIVGYITNKTKLFLGAGKIQFTDELEAVKCESKKLHQRGVQIIIALGHAGAAIDERIAKEAEYVDIVVGGHRKSWMTDQIPQGPEVYIGKMGKRIIVIHEPGYLKYLGMLKVSFDENGNVEKYEGYPIYLHRKIPLDNTALNLIKTRMKRTGSSTYLGMTKVSLCGKCLASECNLANLLLDAMVDYGATKLTHTNKIWNNYPIAVINGGSFRKSLNVSQTGSELTREMLSDVLHFNDMVYTMEIKGRYLQLALEQGATWDETSTGELLQLSGLHVTYNFSRKKGERISRIYVRCQDCRVPKYEHLQKDQMYNLLSTYYVSQGSDGHTGLSSNKMNYINRNIKVLTLLENYLKTYKRIATNVEDRFNIHSVSWKVEVIFKLVFFDYIILQIVKLILSN